MQNNQAPATCSRCGATFPQPPPSGGASGYAVVDGKHICYTCADLQQVAEMAAGDKYGAYVSSDLKTITTWTGGKLADVIRASKRKLARRSWIHGSSYYSIWAKDSRGSTWYGCGSPGIAISLRRVNS